MEALGWYLLIGTVLSLLAFARLAHRFPASHWLIGVFAWPLVLVIMILKRR